MPRKQTAAAAADPLYCRHNKFIIAPENCKKAHYVREMRNAAKNAAAAAAASESGLWAREMVGESLNPCLRLT